MLKIMTTVSSLKPKPRRPRWAVKIVKSPIFGRLMNLPAVAWGVRKFIHWMSPLTPGNVPGADIPLANKHRGNLQATLANIVQDVVHSLGYAGAMVATYERGDSLPIQAIYVNPSLITQEEIHRWERVISRMSGGKSLSLTDPSVARVYVYDDYYKDNLSVKATRARSIMVSNSLFDLFVPIAPLQSRWLMERIQQHLRIDQVIAVPFFVGDELVGNLFAAKQSPISNEDKLILHAFGQQAALAIQGERQRVQASLTQKLILQLQYSLENENEILYQITQGVVAELGYVGAMVATYEPEDASLPVRAFYVNPQIATTQQIQEWEEYVSSLLPGGQVTVIDPNSPHVARVYVADVAYEANLSVRAANSRQVIFSDTLYELFEPIAPMSARPFVEAVQRQLGIQKIVVIPFFWGDKFIGNLFAATQSRSFSQGEMELLQTFGQQAAAGIRNAQLYRQAEERRKVAEAFGKMAFSASARVHELRNHIGAFKVYLQIIQPVLSLSDADLLELGAGIPDRLERVKQILDSLQEPFRETADKLVDVRWCVNRAISKSSNLGSLVHCSWANDLPAVKGSDELLLEVFKGMLQNAAEAILDKPQENGQIEVRGYTHDGFVVIEVEDNGIGIETYNLRHIFELGWTAKQEGVGFGLYWSKDYIEGLGGTMRVESEFKKGTRFFVSLPAAKETK